MTLPVALSIRGVGAVSSVGYSAAECLASVRAGVTRVAETALRSRGGAPLRMALVPAEGLAPQPALDVAPRASRQRRLLRLALTALAEASEADGGRALPVTLVTSAREGDASPLLDDLDALAEGRVRREGSALVALGSAALGLALADAAHRIAAGAEDAVMIVAADSMLDLARLDALQRARRLLVDDAADGFLPGEGAAALVVSAADDPCAIATVAASSVVADGFTREGEAALTGDGLTAAVRDATEGATRPVTDVWASINGEGWTAREWALAARRNHGALAAASTLRHPVEHFGDPGAALGAMMLALAALDAKRRGEAAALVWTWSDEGLRGALRVAR